MSSARVDDDIWIVEKGNNGGSQQHIETEIIINPAANESGSGSKLGHNIDAGLVPDRSGSKSRQYHSLDQNQSAPRMVGTPGKYKVIVVSQVTSLRTWDLAPATTRRRGCLPVGEPEMTDVQKPGPSW
jgi:hypothetical protein